MKPTPVVLVCAFLLQERSKGNNSQWYNYLQSVPQDYTTLICMSEHDVDLLDSALREKYEAMLAKVRRLVGLTSLLHTREGKVLELGARKFLQCSTENNLHGNRCSHFPRNT